MALARRSLGIERRANRVLIEKEGEEEGKHKILHEEEAGMSTLYRSLPSSALSLLIICPIHRLP